MTERLTIAGLAHRGDGIADTPAGPLYVSYTLPGETVTVETVAGHPDRRHLLRVETASPQRIDPVCPHFGVCGGCAMQHWEAAHYHEWKRGLVIEALRQAGIDPGIDAPVEALIDAHGDGRRRATFHARRGATASDILTVGFATPRAHTLVAIDVCPVLAPSLNGAIKAAWAIAEALAAQRKPLDIQVTATDSGLDVDVRGSGPIDGPHAAALAGVAREHRLARLTRHGEMIAQHTIPTVTMGRARVALPPGGFLQATVAGEAALAELVLGHTGKAKNLADLFCGVGPFALRLAERARVAAFDLEAPAIAALAQAAKTTSGLKPVEAAARDLFRRPLVPPELATFDAVVFDPPRQGAQAQAAELAKSKVPLIVAVSCNPATLARDARLLIDGGYRLTQVTPVDQFRYSPHVETVARFARR
jgi:23S rRNA (uracil1939-C5)-methyltransferase